MVFHWVLEVCHIQMKEHHNFAQDQLKELHMNLWLELLLHNQRQVQQAEQEIHILCQQVGKVNYILNWHSLIIDIDLHNTTMLH